MKWHQPFKLLRPLRLLAAAADCLDDLPSDEEVIQAILAAGTFHFVFAPRSAKNAAVRFNPAVNSGVITAKEWEVDYKVDSKVDVTNFEGTSSAVDANTGTGGLLQKQELCCVEYATFRIQTDADGNSNLYNAGVRPGNATVALQLYLTGKGTGPFWNFPTPLFDGAPMRATVRETLSHTINGSGSASFTFPSGSF